MSQALTDFEISHEEFAKIIDEKNTYKGIKENIKNVKDNDVNDETVALNKENSQIANL